MAKDYPGRASQILGWGRDAIEDMTVAGARADINSVERHFYSLLAHVFTLHELLKAWAGKGAWRDSLNALRETDYLLRYFWLARNSEHHDVLLKWGKEAIEFNLKIVDIAKFNQVVMGYRIHDPYMNPNVPPMRVMCYIFNVTDISKIRGAAEPPSAERLASAGVELEGFANTIVLNAFDSRDHGRIEQPTAHLGKPIAPVAIVCSQAALQFYQSKAEELK